MLEPGYGDPVAEGRRMFDQRGELGMLDSVPEVLSRRQ